MSINMQVIDGKAMASEILKKMGMGINTRDKAIETLIGGVNSYLTRNAMYFGKSAINGMSHKYKVLVNIDYKVILDKTTFVAGDTPALALNRLGKAIEEEINKTKLLPTDLNALGNLTGTNYMHSEIKLGLSNAASREAAVEKLAADICEGIFALPFDKQTSVFIPSAPVPNKPQADTCVFQVKE